MAHPFLARPGRGRSSGTVCGSSRFGHQPNKSTIRRRMRVLLLRPIPATSASGWVRSSASSRWASSTSAAALRQRGHEPTIVDLRFGRASGPGCGGRARDSSGSPACTRSSSIRSSDRRARSAAPRPRPSSSWAGTPPPPMPGRSRPRRRRDRVDDGEEIMPALADALAAGRPLAAVPALRLRTRDGWVDAPARRAHGARRGPCCRRAIWSSATARVSLPHLQAGLARRDRARLPLPLHLLLGLAALRPLLPRTVDRRRRRRLRRGRATASSSSTISSGTIPSAASSSREA